VIPSIRATPCRIILEMMMMMFVGSSLCLLGILPLVILAEDDNVPQVARCLVDFARSDSDQNQQIDSQEFINLVIERDCQFILENDVTSIVFRYLACTCQSYDTDTKCCDDYPILYRPDSEKQYPANYMLDICAKLEEYCNRDDNNNNNNNDTNNNTTTTGSPSIQTDHPSSNQVDDSSNSTTPNYDIMRTQPVVPTTPTNSSNDQDQTTNNDQGWIWGLSFVVVLVGMVGGYMMMYKWSSVRSFLQIQNHSQSTTIAKGNIHGDAVCINDCMPHTQDEDSAPEESEPDVSMEDTTVDDEENGRGMGHDTSTDDAAAAVVTTSCGDDESQGSSSYQTGSMGTQQTPFSMAIDEEYRKSASSGKCSHFFAYDFAGLVKNQNTRHSDRKSTTETSIPASHIPDGGSPPIIEWAMYPVPSSPPSSSPRAPRSAPR
jgi:hypothetical protein